MAGTSLAKYVAYIVVEALTVLGIVAGILTFLTPIIGVAWALALVLVVVLIAVILALLLYLRTQKRAEPAPPIPAPVQHGPQPPQPSSPSRDQTLPGSGRYYIERNGMLFIVEMIEREGPAREPLPQIVNIPLCPRDYVRMVKAGDETDWSGTILRRNFRCPNGDSKGVIAYGEPEHTLEVVKALAVGRWHNGDPFDPLLRERPKAPVRSPPKSLPEPRLRLEPEAVKIAPTRKATFTPSQRPARVEPKTIEEPIPSRTIEVVRVASMRLPVKKGDQVYGHLREEEGQTFSWFIVDLGNLGLMERGEAYDYEVGEEDVPSATPDWTAPSDGPWFLAFDAYRKQYTRNVTVELWRRYLP